ncbi:MAG: hypothetical protein Kow0062_17740 [Acidobacteriota bacterium]
MPTTTSRVQRLARMVRERRWDALRAQLERRLLPNWLFYRRRLVFCRMTDVRRPARDLPFITVREASPDDEPLLRQVRDHREGFSHMFARGDVCYLALAGERPAAFLWIEPGGVHRSAPARYSFALGERGCWSYAVEVHPDFRLKGAFGKLWSDAFDMIRARGFDAIYTSMPEDENLVSLRSHTRLGFEVLCRFAMLRVLGVTRYRVRWEDGRTERGAGFWEGHDRLAR